MLGFSLQKLLVLAAIIGAVWYGFKIVGRLDKARKTEARMRGEQKPGRAFRWPSRGGQTASGEPKPQDMVQCPHCKAYVPALGSHDCDGPPGRSA